MYDNTSDDYELTPSAKDLGGLFLCCIVALILGSCIGSIVTLWVVNDPRI